MNQVRKAYLSQIDSSSRVWDGSPKIFCKLDWFTGVFNNCSVNDVLKSFRFFDFDFSDLDEVFSKRFLCQTGITPELCFNFNGVIVLIKQDSVLSNFGFDHPDFVSSFKFFDSVFPYIRLDISGSGLDYLRSIGIDSDLVFFNKLYLPRGEYHVTRCDFAFDLVDYCSDFLDQCKEACRLYENKSTHRVCCGSSGVRWSERGGDQNTLYLGSPGSDKLLRIYDKLLQYDRSNQLGNCPYISPDGLIPQSWIRIELQARREKVTHSLLFDVGNFEGVFRYIFDKFAIHNLKYEYTYEVKAGDVIDCWLTLFDWQKIPNILLNKNFVQFKSVQQRAEEYIFGQASSNILLLLAIYGKNQFISIFDDILRDLQLSSVPCNVRRMHRLENMFFQVNDYKLPPFVEKRSDRLYYIK